MIKKVLALALCLGGLTACGVTVEQQAEPDKHKPKPKLSPIKIYNHNGTWGHEVDRHCDGTTLIYRDEYKGGLAVVPNSPLCPAS